MAFLVEEGTGEFGGVGTPPTITPPGTLAPTKLLLEAAGIEPLAVGLATGYIVRRLDLGDPETRVVAENAPDANGTIDTTQFTGARTVLLAVRLVPRNGFQPAMLEQRLRAFTSPRLRPVMTVTRDGIEDRQVTLRRGPWTSPIEQATHQDVTVQWVSVGSGFLESVLPHTATIYAATVGGELGRAYDLTHDRTYPPSPILGAGTLFNAGNAPAAPLLRIYGPCTNPTIINLTQGLTLAFTGLTILAGQFVEIDTSPTGQWTGAGHTIRYNGLATDSRYNTLSFPTSAWWSLEPGENIVRYQPATSSPPSNVQVTWKDADY